MARVLQCGVRSRVRAITRLTSTSVILRGAPGAVHPAAPAGRFRTKRCRHRPTVCRVTPAVAAISPLVLVEAHARTEARALAKPCAVSDDAPLFQRLPFFSSHTTSGVGRAGTASTSSVFNTKNVGVNHLFRHFQLRH